MEQTLQQTKYQIRSQATHLVQSTSACESHARNRNATCIHLGTVGGFHLGCLAGLV